MDKYVQTFLHPYLCIDPVPDPNPPPRDAEEFGMSVHEFSWKEVRGMLKNGAFSATNAAAIMLAMDKLEEMGYHE